MYIYIYIYIYLSLYSTPQVERRENAKLNQALTAGEPKPSTETTKKHFNMPASLGKHNPKKWLASRFKEAKHKASAVSLPSLHRHIPSKLPTPTVLTTDDPSPTLPQSDDGATPRTTPSSPSSGASAPPLRQEEDASENKKMSEKTSSASSSKKGKQTLEAAAKWLRPMRGRQVCVT
jgi:hypothetical protein